MADYKTQLISDVSDFDLFEKKPNPAGIKRFFSKRSKKERE